MLPPLLIVREETELHRVVCTAVPKIRPRREGPLVEPLAAAEEADEKVERDPKRVTNDAPVRGILMGAIEDMMEGLSVESAFVIVCWMVVARLAAVWTVRVTDAATVAPPQIFPMDEVSDDHTVASNPVLPELALAGAAPTRILRVANPEEATPRTVTVVAPVRA